ncbi:LOW QUALITY PROTEIN: hypothetical protein CVT25_002113 [Psilocybe cyanescens]|uniref:Protein CPL1-like domain-containing protein n=1 Tax=Psilocybe cyanescens TaxID=93625 RepID=A0A409XCH5_PSICY|nr:LOW QUALITY PROTEIN: hypothetical protein CVT25_002113 [Psilocybe cyanescens]
MRTATIQFIVFLFPIALVAAGGGRTDICGECRGSLNIPNYLSPKKFNLFGNINIPNYIASNSLAISAVSYGGRDVVTNALTSLFLSVMTYIHEDADGLHLDLFRKSWNVQLSPALSAILPIRKPFYSPSPYGSYPPDCVCSKPYTVCNGKCGLYKACPSSYGKRALSESSGKLLCPIGLSACQIIGRGTESWECVDTKQDLESCGGCMIQSSYPGFSKEEGVDCTAINGISDVSCVDSRCLVRRCMPGYSVNKAGDYCIENHGYPLLISQTDIQHSYGN